MSVFERYSKPGSKPPYYITIKDSTIQGSGKGAFANCDIPEGTVLGEYLGKVYYESDHPDLPDSDYLFNVNRHGRPYKTIDGASPRVSSWVRYVNSPQTARAANAFFYQYDERIFIKTSKVIPAGQEIFAYYGDTYINDKLRQYFTKDNKPKISIRKKGIKCTPPKKSPRRSPKKSPRRR